MGFMAVVANAAAVIEAIKKAKDLLKTLDPNRSVVLEVQNRTSGTLRRVSQNHDDGGFAEPPSLEILPGQVDVYGSRDDGVASGTKGRVSYESTDGYLLHIDWENSVLGTSSCKASIVGGNAGVFQTKHTCGVGEPAHMQYIVEPGVTPKQIQRKSTAEAGSVSEIATIRSESGLVTAVRTASDTLKLIPWTIDFDGSISRLHDGAEAGEASNIAIARGRLFVTACSAASGNLKLIPWTVNNNGFISRAWDDGAEGGEARNISIVALSDTLFVTPLRTGAGNLKLIAWELLDDDTIERRGENEAGAVKETSIVQISDADGNHRFVTAVRAGNDELLMIVWSITTNGHTIKRLSFNHGQTGRLGPTRICAVTTHPDQLVTSVSMAAGDSLPGNLLLITWGVTQSGDIMRQAESHGEQTGRITDHALMSRPDGVLCAVNGGSGLKLIAYRVSAQGAIQRTADSDDQADWAGIVTLCSEPLVGDAPIVTAVRAGNGNMKLISWADQ